MKPLRTLVLPVLALALLSFSHSPTARPTVVVVEAMPALAVDFGLGDTFSSMVLCRTERASGLRLYTVELTLFESNGRGRSTTLRLSLDQCGELVEAIQSGLDEISKLAPRKPGTISIASSDPTHWNLEIGTDSKTGPLGMQIGVGHESILVRPKHYKDAVTAIVAAFNMASELRKGG